MRTAILANLVGVGVTLDASVATAPGSFVDAAHGTGLAHSSASASSEVRPLIFIHVPKTGGTSVEEAMGTWNEAFNGTTLECAGVPIMEKRFDKHATAADAKLFYSDEEWEAAYKFIIVCTWPRPWIIIHQTASIPCC